ncbi:MAG: hypothetical protein A2W35_07305 [Chloroflexi bacterium RBG_16_57_11]|nr:MAG: hypothetical protein A2W35_07305 [Chloroflexi bacterium RBG_16_57_11]
MYDVSITRLRVRSIFYMPLFMLNAIRSGTQAQKAQGFQDFATRIEAWDTHWTKTVWSQEDSMKRFRSSGAHKFAMRILSEICSEASYTRWQQETPEPPAWEEAQRRMLAQGILSKVKHPSAFHQAGRTAPELTRGRSVRSVQDTVEG